MSSTATMSRVQILITIAAMREASAAARATGTLALVPTMGALHEGHLSLVRAAKKLCNTVAVSIFVNPTQFGPKEDFTQYPRTFERDLQLLEQEDVALVFAPSAEEIYPQGSEATFVEVSAIGDRLDGISRPGHFRGVATIVAKLFHIVSPDMAFFGQKDAAQVAVLRAMVRDLNFPLQLIVCPTVREVDGLAMSSRNRYLSLIERKQALTISHSLHAARSLSERGERDASELRKAMLHELQNEPAITIEYAELVNPDTLLPVSDVAHGALLAIAARVGNTRLIDNLLLAPAGDRA